MKKQLLALLLPVTLLTGCSSVTDYVPSFLTPYRPDIHQGNVVTSEMVENLHEGMTKNQVIFLLGTPTLRSVFHNEEWSYVYYLNPRGGKATVRKLIVTFDEDGRVGQIQADPMPDETDADLAILGERARESTLKRQSQLQQEKSELEQETTRLNDAANAAANAEANGADEASQAKGLTPKAAEGAPIEFVDPNKPQAE